MSNSSPAVDRNQFLLGVIFTFNLIGLTGWLLYLSVIQIGVK